MTKKHLDVVWEEQPDQIRRYYELLPSHERLSSEVEFHLKHLLKNAKMEYAHLSHRAKTLESFCEKICRKNYKDPMTEITDLAGVRVVFLYTSDLSIIKKIVEDSFVIIERVDKSDGQGAERFGYNALHYLVKIKPEQVGIRLGDLHALICEVQIRTALQDAWALVAHHLSYKQELDIPKELRRKLNALSGLFEAADDQLSTIRDARLQYQDKIASSISKSSATLLDAEINLDSLMAYIKWKFPERGQPSQGDAAELLNELQALDYINLSDLNVTIERALNAVLSGEREYPPVDEGDEPTQYVGVGLIRGALAQIHESYRNEKYHGKLLTEIKQFSHLIRPQNHN